VRALREGAAEPEGDPPGGRGTRGLRAGGISLDAESAVLRGCLAKEALPWTHLFEEGKGWKNPVVVRYRVRGIPDARLIDRDGNVVAMDLRGEELQAAVAAVLD
jgi:hypothetical protein